MFFDEFYFHRQRGLQLWERIGHPVDTASVLLCFSYLVFAPQASFSLAIYIGLAAFSCLLVTKDEFVHTQACKAQENWLHSVLFVLHPIVFLSAYFIWLEHSNAAAGSELLWLGLKGQILIVLSFGVFQTVYWNFVRSNA